MAINRLHQENWRNFGFNRDNPFLLCVPNIDAIVNMYKLMSKNQFLKYKSWFFISIFIFGLAFNTFINIWLPFRAYKDPANSHSENISGPPGRQRQAKGTPWLRRVLGTITDIHKDQRLTIMLARIKFPYYYHVLGQKYIHTYILSDCIENGIRQKTWGDSEKCQFLQFSWCKLFNATPLL